jgi:hypothetical protein
MARVSSAHHVLGIELLLSQFGDSQGTVLLRSTGGEGSKSNHEEMKTREGDHVDSKLTEIAVELTRESEAASGTADSSRHKMVKISVGRGGKLKSSEADVVQGLVIKSEALVGILHTLVNRKGGIVWFHNGIRHLGGRNDGVSRHDSVGVFFTDLGDQKSTHTRSSTTTHGVGHLEALEAIRRLGLLTDNIKDRVDQLGTLSVMSLGPVVTSSGLTENKVIGSEKLSEGASTDGVHSTRLKIHEDSTGHIATTSSLIVVHIDSLQLKIRITVVGTGGVNTVFIGDDLPELGTDLVTALASLDVDDFIVSSTIFWSACYCTFV